MKRSTSLLSPCQTEEHRVQAETEAALGVPDTPANAKTNDTSISWTSDSQIQSAWQWDPPGYLEVWRSYWTLRSIVICWKLWLWDTRLVSWISLYLHLSNGMMSLAKLWESPWPVMFTGSDDSCFRIQCIQILQTLTQGQSPYSPVPWVESYDSLLTNQSPHPIF